MEISTKPVAFIRFLEDQRNLDCHLFKWDTPLPSEAKALEGFYAIWRSKFDGQNFPAWKDFKFEDFKGWHSNLRVMTLGKNLSDPKHNLIIGQTFSQYWGKKTIYEQIQEGNPPSKDTVKKYYRYLQYIYDHHYGFNIGAIPKNDGRLSSVLWLELPLADNGQDVTHIISAIYTGIRA